MALIYISLVVNVLVAGFWGIVLGFRLLPQQAEVYGTDSPGVRILASMYVSIALTSLIALFWQQYTLAIALVLFPFQITYKLMSGFFVGTLKHPVVLSNIAISVLLLISLYRIVV